MVRGRRPSPTLLLRLRKCGDSKKFNPRSSKVPQAFTNEIFKIRSPKLVLLRADGFREPVIRQLVTKRAIFADFATTSFNLECLGQTTQSAIGDPNRELEPFDRRGHQPPQIAAPGFLCCDKK